MFAGQMMAGASLSVTLTVKVQLAELPFASVAVAVTTVAPIPKTVDEALAKRTGAHPSWLQMFDRLDVDLAKTLNALWEKA